MNERMSTIMSIDMWLEKYIGFIPVHFMTCKFDA